MKVLVVNTSDIAGGAAVASSRLVAALNNNGVKAKMLVRDKLSENISVVSLPHQWLAKWHFLWERFSVWCSLCFRRTHLWEIDKAVSGNDITSLKDFQEADVIHLAWINQGMLSIDGITKILKSGKPVVWTLHDLWPASSICHYSRGCDHFIAGCHDCPLLTCAGKKDASYKVWQQKKQSYSAGDIHFVTCSKWLEKQAGKSGLLDDMSLSSIPNPIDTVVFSPSDRVEAKKALGISPERKVLLFVAQKVTDERKGAASFVKALEMVKAKWPEESASWTVALLGSHSEELAERIPQEVRNLGYVSGDEALADVYRAADTFVLPSMEDNLPNTIMEAMACGVPCVGNNVGGIPEMIDHDVNGYVAVAGDIADLAAGLHWVLSDSVNTELGEKARSKVLRCYSQQSVALKYIDVYSHAMARKRYLV